MTMYFISHIMDTIQRLDNGLLIFFNLTNSVACKVSTLPRFKKTKQNKTSSPDRVWYLYALSRVHQLARVHFVAFHYYCPAFMSLWFSLQVCDIPHMY